MAEDPPSQTFNGLVDSIFDKIAMEHPDLIAPEDRRGAEDAQGCPRFQAEQMPAGARWVGVVYGDGVGTPQERNIWALPGETAEAAGEELVTALAKARGHVMYLFFTSEDPDESPGTYMRRGFVPEYALFTADP